jgi:SAM-dependent methyltransferase
LTGPSTICDYEGHDYRARFWERGREYEDLAERIALRRLLPARGRRLAEIGAGFGRLADLYDSFSQVILLDPARSLLQEAQERLGRGSRFLYVRGNVYNLPLADGACDTVVIVRVLHHLQDVRQGLGEMARSLTGGGIFVCEYANKRNLKAVGRYLLRRQPWSPFRPEPLEFAPLHFDFHPRWMTERLQEVGLVSERELAVSTFRVAILKRLIPPRALAFLDGLLQPLGGCCKLSPSVLLRATATESPHQPLPENPFRCPTCHSKQLAQADHALSCGACGRSWPIIDGIYDFGDQ